MFREYSSKFAFYFRSPSTLYGIAIGLLMFLSYAWAYRAWSNPGLLALSAFIGVFIPFYSRLSNHLDEKVSLKTARVSDGRVCRLLLQLAMNIFIFKVLVASGVLAQSNLNPIGGVLGTALLTTGASQGLQYLAIMFANREIGDKNRNVLIGLSLNIVITALATFGLGWARDLFVFGGIGFAIFVLGMGILSDLRAKLAPPGGIGIFFGTFNPFHLTHLEIIQKAIEERGLSKVYLHSTVIPKLHQQALNNGEIRIARYEGGMRVYEKTAKADVHVNYFPTGLRFFEFETRRLLMELSLAQSGIIAKVEVLSFPEEYETHGFYGIIRKVRDLHPGKRLHGIHGSDLGGMWIRSIYDESGWIYPYAVRRQNAVSATAIRNGAFEMAAPAIRPLLQDLKTDSRFLRLNNRRFSLEKGVLKNADAQN